MSEILDHKYYQVVSPNGVAEKLLIAARDRIFRDFITWMRPTPLDRIVDVGVSEVINDGANVLERTYPYQRNITACGLGEGREFQATFPEVDYIRLLKPNARLPFDDNCFDIAVSNAVLEHVGSRKSGFLHQRTLPDCTAGFSQRPKPIFSD